MKKRIATKAEVHHIWHFLKSISPLAPSWEEFETDSMIAICEVNKDLRIANITEIFGCANPECGCKIIEYPTILILRESKVEFPKEDEEETHYYVSPDDEKAINSQPELN